MIKYIKGNLLKDKSEALVNTVNCVGVMGKGIALQFKKAFPNNYKEYKKACDKKLIKPGFVFLYKTDDLFGTKWIINFPTKNHWKEKSKIEYIENGLKHLKKIIIENSIKSIAIPPLGAGLGGLDWNIVKEKIANELSNLENVEINIYEPSHSPKSSEMSIRTKKPNMTIGRAIIIKLLEIYSNHGYEHTKLEVQKLAYFLQESGFPLRLKFEAHNFGPYADNLNHVLEHIDGHYITGVGDRVSKAEIKLLPGAIKEADLFLNDHPEAVEKLEKVSSLIAGYETPLSMEVLATVHWIITRSTNGHLSIADVKEKVFDWNTHKQMIKDNYIIKACKRLIDEGWVDGSKLSMVS